MLRCDIEAALSIGMTTATQRSRALAIAAGNSVSARPLGVIDGIDMGYTGRVRENRHRIHPPAPRQRRSGAHQPAGHSLSGKTPNLSMGDIAEAAAIALAAEKLIYVVEQEGILNEHGTLISNLSAQEARELLDNQRVQPNQRRLLQSAVNAVEKQVQRTQILSGRQDGSLIRELFTRHGAGTSVARAAL